MQQQRLAQEMQDAAVVSLIQKRPKMKASRSLPAMVLKHVPKTRVSSIYNELEVCKIMIKNRWERMFGFSL